MTAAGGRGGAGSVVELPRNASTDRGFSVEAGSYRDRNGSVFYYDGEIFRGISAKALANWERLIATRFFHDFMSRGSVVRTVGSPSTPMVTPCLKRSSAACSTPVSTAWMSMRMITRRNIRPISLWPNGPRHNDLTSRARRDILTPPSTVTIYPGTPRYCIAET